MKKMSYNKTKALQLSASFFLLIACIPIAFKMTFLPDAVFNIISSAAMLFYVFAICFGMGSIKSKRAMTDELSQANDAAASNVAVSVITAILLIIGLLSKFFKFELTLNFEMVWCIVLLISVLRDGFYLYLESRGQKNAGNED